MSAPETASAEADYLTLDHQVCFALAVASRSVVSLYRPLLEPMGLTHPQFLVMLALWENEPLSVKEISGLLQLDPATVSPMLKRLQETGLIERHRSVADERSVRLTLTPRGRELREQARDIPLKMLQRLGMSVEELESLHATLTHLIGRAHATVGITPIPS